MKILVINCSPKKETSLTYKSSLFLKKYYGKEDEFKYIFAADGRFPEENYEDFRNADLVVLCSSLYHFSIHAQMIHLFADMEKNLILSEKCMTYLTTSAHNFDQSPHTTVRLFAERNNMYYLEGLSLADVSVLPLRKECSPKEKFHGIEELYTWFGYTKDCAEMRISGTKKKLKAEAEVTILDTYETETAENQELIAEIKRKYESYGGNVKVIALRNYNLKPCIGCNACYTDWQCCIKDEFEKAFNDIYMDTDILVNVGEMRYGLLSYQYKIMHDRQVQYGRRNFIDETIVLFICTGDFTEQEMDCFREHEMGLQAMQGFFIADFVNAKDGSMYLNVSDGIYKTVAAYNNDVLPPTNYYTISLNRQFARLSVELKPFTPKDFEYYTKTGWLDEIQTFPVVRPVHSLEESMHMLKMRTIPYDEMLEKLPDTVQITDRRAEKHIPISERKRKV